MEAQHELKRLEIGFGNRGCQGGFSRPPDPHPEIDHHEVRTEIHRPPVNPVDTSFCPAARQYE